MRIRHVLTLLGAASLGACAIETRDEVDVGQVESAALGTPVLISPSGTNEPTTPTYRWNRVSGATRYTLWVDDVTGARIRQTYTASALGCSSGSVCSITPSVVLNPGAARFRVRAQTLFQSGPWSSWKSFTVGTPAPPPVTIYDIQNPTSTIAPGAHVVIDNANVKVTGVAATMFFMQEASASGFCEVSGAPVAYRGITVQPLTPDLTLAIGQRVRVEGTVTEIDSNTTITGATVTRVGSAGTPHMHHCERDSSLLEDEAFEGVLVQTSGSTEDQREPDASGEWLLDSCFCFGPSCNGPLVVDDLMYFHEFWTPSWHWVKGVMVNATGTFKLQPRNVDDVSPDNGDDACL
jgi:hypothetical protein